MPRTSRSTEPGWSELADLVTKLRNRWDRGQYLRAYAMDEQFQPVRLKVSRPTAAEILTDLEVAQLWSRRFEADAASHDGSLRVEYTAVKGRGLGTNEVPEHVVVDSFEDLCSLLGTRAEVSRLDDVLAHTRQHQPALTAWVEAHPMDAIEQAGHWPQLIAVVNWISTQDPSLYYLRELDLPGVDTKFVERHRKILGRLLTEALPRARIDLSANQFDRRYGFRTKPRLVRLRPLDPDVDLWGLPPVQELALRTEDLAALEPATKRVFVVENEVTYLAFPDMADSIVVFGEGRAAATLERIVWFTDCEVVYWGDVDTHGFVILDRLRSVFPHVRSMLMDRATLFGHRDRWVTEETQATGPLEHLTDDESTLFAELLAGAHGERVRLEQERIRFAMLQAQLGELGAPLPREAAVWAPPG